MIAGESTARGRSSLTASTIGVLVLLVGCRQGGDGSLNSRKDTDVMQNASASEDVPIIVVSAKREVDSQDRLGEPRAAHTPTLAGHSDSAPHFSR
jgi:hypothetical protein